MEFLIENNVLNLYCEYDGIYGLYKTFHKGDLIQYWSGILNKWENALLLDFYENNAENYSTVEFKILYKKKIFYTLNVNY